MVPLTLDPMGSYLVLFVHPVSNLTEDFGLKMTVIRKKISLELIFCKITSHFLQSCFSKLKILNQSQEFF